MLLCTGLHTCIIFYKKLGVHFKQTTVGFRESGGSGFRGLIQRSCFGQEGVFPETEKFELVETCVTLSTSSPGNNPFAGVQCISM